MTTTRILSLPAESFRLEELNLPQGLARDLAGRSVEVEIWPEVAEDTSRPKPVRRGEVFSGWMDSNGNSYSDYHPIRVSFTYRDGGVWQLPRHWLKASSDQDEPCLDPAYAVAHRVTFTEGVHLPSKWDLIAINFPFREAEEAAGKPTIVQVQIAAGEPVKVLWEDATEKLWRIPHNWRRRRIKLPVSDVLVRQGIPEEVAERFRNRAVSLNYHPGSLCCLKEQYRFRDEEGHRWPVFIRDCLLLGYGDGEEYRA